MDSKPQYTEQQYQERLKHDTLLDADFEFRYYMKRAQEAAQKLNQLCQQHGVLSYQPQLLIMSIPKQVADLKDEKKAEVPTNGEVKAQ